MIARTSSKIFLCKSYRSVLTNIAPHCLTDVLNSNFDKTSIKQLQVVPLRMNIAELREQQGLSVVLLLGFV